MEDDIRADIESAMKGEEATSVVDTPIETTNTVDTALEADEKLAAVDTAIGATETPASVEAKEAAAATETTPSPYSAPEEWASEVKEMWGTLPAAVQMQIAQQQAEWSNYKAQTEGQVQVASALKSIVSPYLPLMEKAGVHPLDTIQQTLGMYNVLWTGSPQDKAAIAGKILTECGVDLELLVGELSRVKQIQENPMSSFITEAIQRELGPIKQYLQPKMQPQTQQPEFDPSLLKIKQELATVSQDTKNYPFFQLLRNEIADVIEIKAKQGVELGIADAYKLVKSLHPELNANTSVAGITPKGSAPTRVNGGFDNDSDDIRSHIMNAIDTIGA